MMDICTRRTFLTEAARAAATGLVVSPLLSGCASKPAEQPAGDDPAHSSTSGSVGSLRLPGKPGDHDLVIAENKDYARATEEALNGFGGLEHFVKQGDSVILSPNIAFARAPEVGANTHPDVIRKVILLCEAAGAASITVMDYTLDQPKVAFEVCGANQAVQGTLAKLVSPDREELYKEVDFSGTKEHKARNLKQKLPKELLRANVLISMPVAKDHEAAGISFSMKKGMGLIWDRKSYHRADLHQCIADMTHILRPSLIIMDATRALQDRGPKGPGEVTQPNQVVVGVDPVAMDTYCCRYLTLKGTKPEEVPHLKMAEAYGVGTMDLSSLKITEI